VKADDLLLLAGADQLHRRRLLVVRVHHRVVQRREGRLVHLDLVVAVLLARLGLGLRDGQGVSALPRGRRDGLEKDERRTRPTVPMVG